MRRNLAAYRTCQTFLNYPFDAEFADLADALNFAVVAAGMLPVCARDLTSPDHPRLEMLVDAISNCHYSAHDFSRCKGEGPDNFARMNMPVEMGMAVFYALGTQRTEHRCTFFVSAPHDYQEFASDLAGLDPKCHEDDQLLLVSQMYDWLRAVVPQALFNNQPTIGVIEKFKEFQGGLTQLRGSGSGSTPTHEERRELMYQLCSACGWWDWRKTRLGQDEFPAVPLAMR